MALISILILSLIYPSLTHAQSATYFTKAEILSHFFAASEKVDFEKFSLTAVQITGLKKKLAVANIPASWTIYTARTKNRTDGYAIIDHVKGKEEPITFALCISPDGKLREVEILQYRESHGGAVKNKSFRKQFVGKSATSPLKIGQDIQNVSGATISSRNLAAGVKRALAVWSILYQKDNKL